jgi:hypothetical protein
MEPTMSDDNDPEFEIGNILSGRIDGDMAQAIVLDRSEDTDALMLMRLPTGELFEVAPDGLSDWSLAPSPTARWVEVYELDAEQPFFAAYLPNFDAAMAVHRAFAQREGDFRVDIYAASEEEIEKLEALD